MSQAQELDDRQLADEIDRVDRVRALHARNLKTWATQEDVDELHQYKQFLEAERDRRVGGLLS